MGPDVKIKHLLALSMLGEARNFTQAAETLCITQSTLSKQIKELEEQAQVRLFERTTRSLAPTPAGRIMIDASNKLLADLREAIREARNLQRGAQSRLSVAATPHIAESLLPNVLAKFLEADPSIELNFYDGLTSDMMRRVRDGDAEVFLTAFMTHEALLPGLVVTPLFESAVDMVVVFRGNHAFAQHEIVEWEQLAEQQIILLRPDKQVHTAFDTMLQSRGVAFLNMIRVSSFGTALGMVKAGLGVAVFPRYAIEGEPMLMFRPLRDAQHRRAISVIHRQGEPLSPNGSRFLEEIQAALTESST